MKGEIRSWRDKISNVFTSKAKKSWCVYILKCSDDSLYTGITNDINKRIESHNNGTGAKYTRGRGPVVLMTVKNVSSKSEALKLEYRVKKQPKKNKIKYLDDCTAER